VFLFCTKLCLYNITATAALQRGGEVWLLNIKKCQQSETAQEKFRSLVRLTKLDHPKIQQFGKT
jgi:hypothetical protein